MIDRYDYGMRYFDPGLARFTSIDPLAEIYNSHSPYHYALNNPIRYTDLMGMGAEEKGKEEEDPTIVWDDQNRTVTVNETIDGSPVITSQATSTNEDGSYSTTTTSSQTTTNTTSKITEEEVTTESSTTTTEVTITKTFDSKGNQTELNVDDIDINSESGSIIGPTADRIAADVSTRGYGFAYSNPLFKKAQAATLVISGTKEGVNGLVNAIENLSILETLGHNKEDTVASPKNPH
ncbi:MAG: RHS repeat-associated core domain-containing protein [Bacteroidota bacterium]